MSRVMHVDQAERVADAALDGEARADAALARIAAGASDPDVLLRALLNTLAESGRVAALVLAAIRFGKIT